MNAPPTDHDSASARNGISFWLYAGYGVGMIGERIFRDAPALLLMVYMTNYLAIPAALAGIVVFVPKIVMILFDPLVGSLSDRLTTRWGRRRPPMLVGALLTSASFVLLFHPPSFAAVTARAMYMGVMVTVAFAAYAIFSVPYLTMASEMTASADERSRLMSVRVAFMAVPAASMPTISRSAWVSASRSSGATSPTVSCCWWAFCKNSAKAWGMARSHTFASMSCTNP